MPVNDGAVLVSRPEEHSDIEGNDKVIPTPAARKLHMPLLKRKLIAKRDAALITHDYNLSGAPGLEDDPEQEVQHYRERARSGWWQDLIRPCSGKASVEACRRYGGSTP